MCKKIFLYNLLFLILNIEQKAKLNKSKTFVHYTRIKPPLRVVLYLIILKKKTKTKFAKINIIDLIMLN